MPIARQISLPPVAALLVGLPLVALAGCFPYEDDCYDDPPASSPGYVAVPQCYSSSGCVTGRCDNGRCVPSGPCASDFQCGLLESCQAGRCAPWSFGARDAAPLPRGDGGAPPDGASANHDGAATLGDDAAASQDAGRDGGAPWDGGGADLAPSQGRDAGGEAGISRCDAASCGPPAPPLCRWDHQCGPAGRCAAGRCQATCVSSSACGTGDECRDGHCQPSAQPGGACRRTSDYGGGSCINGHCHAACAADEGCARPGDVCDRGLCRPDGRPRPQCLSNADCAADRLCVDAICRTPCASDVQCGPGCAGTVCSAHGFCKMPEE